MKSQIEEKEVRFMVTESNQEVWKLDLIVFSKD